MLLALAGSARVAGAQQIHGVVRDSASAQPIPGAVVAVLDAAGHQLARSITSGRGAYQLPAANAARVQVLRIGFRPRDMAVPGGAGDRVLDVPMQALPQMLDRVLVTGRTSCPSTTHGAAAVALWEQARAGLLATVVARETATAQVRMLLFDRTLDPRTGELVSQTARARQGPSNRPFMAARPAAEFVTRGYLIEDATGRTFEAPDAEVLLDPSFASSHCFTVRDGDGAHSNEIGLEFRPARSVDAVVDVTGTLWMDRNPLALRTLEFRYTNLEPAAMRIGSGGYISFAELRPGIVFIDRWYLRLAGLTMTRVGYDGGNGIAVNRSERWRTEVTQLSESGGQLVSARWPDGVHWDANMGRVTGTIVERGTTRPVVGALVWLDGAPDTVRTDANGTFVLGDVLPGPWLVSANNEQFPEYGLSQTTTARLTAGAGESTPIRLEFAPLGEWIGEVCQDQPPARPNTSTIIGRVVMPDSTPAAQATIEVHWITTLSQDSQGNVMAGTANRTFQTAKNGSFHLCGVDRKRTIILTAKHSGADSTTVRRELDADESLAVVNIHLPAVGSPGEKAVAPVRTPLIR